MHPCHETGRERRNISGFSSTGETHPARFSPTKPTDRFTTVYIPHQPTARLLVHRITVQSTALPHDSESTATPLPHDRNAPHYRTTVHYRTTTVHSRGSLPHDDRRTPPHRAHRPSNSRGLHTVQLARFYTWLVTSHRPRPSPTRAVYTWLECKPNV